MSFRKSRTPAQVERQMPWATARFEVMKLGLTLRNTGFDYRVNYRGGTEATAYYTDDLEDAVDTARAMACLQANQ